MTEHVKKLHPTDIININGKPVAKVPVTVDGTWMRRGHNSKQGVVFIMSVHTGGKSPFCRECLFHKNKLGIDTKEYKAWYKDHKSSCELNHNFSSGKMETEGAIELYTTSIE